MEYRLKYISPAGIAEAIAKAELYRSLNEPEEAESICRDILTIEPQHQLALRLLGLALTDQFAGGPSDRDREAEQTFLQLNDRYERLYYTGIAYERRAKAQLGAGQVHGRRHQRQFGDAGGNDGFGQTRLAHQHVIGGDGAGGHKPGLLPAHSAIPQVGVTGSSHPARNHPPGRLVLRAEPSEGFT